MTSLQQARLTAEDIKAARELVEKATPGPWRHADDIRPRLVLYHFDANAYAEKKFNPIGEAYCDVAQQSRANMRFICEARSLRCAADYVARGSWDPGAALSVTAEALDYPWFKFAYEAERCAKRPLA